MLARTVGTRATSEYGMLHGFRFSVSCSRFTNPVGFMQVSGLSADTSPMEWKEITNPVTALKFPTEISFSDVTLTRGLDLDDNFTTWWNDVIASSKGGASVPLIRHDVDIAVYGKGTNSMGGAILAKQFKLYNAWPRSIKLSDIDANSSGVMIQSVVLANEGIDFNIKT